MTSRVTAVPGICGGRPTVRGTRITAQTVLEFLAAGDRIEDVLAEYPTLTREDVLACLAYAARLLAHCWPADDDAPAGGAAGRVS